MKTDRDKLDERLDEAHYVSCPQDFKGDLLRAYEVADNPKAEAAFFIACHHMALLGGHKDVAVLFADLVTLIK